MFKARHLSLIAILSVLVLSAAGAFRVSAQRQRTNKTIRPSAANPDDVVDLAPSKMRPVIEYYLGDRGSLLRAYLHEWNGPQFSTERVENDYADKVIQ